jgi:hypothetical protein
MKAGCGGAAAGAGAGAGWVCASAVAGSSKQASRIGSNRIVASLVTFAGVFCRNAPAPVREAQITFG